MSKSGSSSGNKSQRSSGSTVPKNSPPNPRNRFQKSGSEAVYEVKETKDSVIYRVDLPGCPASDLTYWIDGNNVHFLADEPVMSEYDHDGRKYEGTMVFNPVAYNVKEAKAELRDGVMWITVPKIPDKNIKLTVVEKMH
ncbi:hypothetical protein N665_0109s0031 [Sinapis alba]|nr:hypothetical protein N665_0109s0031 [Sinapis alba]